VWAAASRLYGRDAWNRSLKAFVFERSPEQGPWGKILAALQRRAKWSTTGNAIASPTDLARAWPQTIDLSSGQASRRQK
jgi:hypothetical protein